MKIDQDNLQNYKYQTETTVENLILKESTVTVRKRM